MPLVCLVRVPWDEEGTEWSPGAFLRNPPFQVPRWITRGQVRARASVVRFLVKFLSALNEECQAIVVSFFWEPYRNPWDRLRNEGRGKWCPGFFPNSMKMFRLPWFPLCG